MGLLYVECMRVNNSKNINPGSLAKYQSVPKSIIMFKLLDMDPKEERIIGQAGIHGVLLGESHPYFEFKWVVITQEFN